MIQDCHAPPSPTMHSHVSARPPFPPIPSFLLPGPRPLHPTGIPPMDIHVRNHNHLIVVVLLLLAGNR